MNRKKLKNLTSCIMSGIIVTTLISSSAVFAEETTQSGQVSTSTESEVAIKATERASVHDSSIVKDGSTYYVTSVD